MGSSEHFQDLVERELTKARSKHGNQRNLHEAFAVIMEEVDELWDLVRAKKENRNPFVVLEELVQIAAMAQRAAEDLGLCKPR